MAAGTQGWNVNSAKDRQDLRRGICKLHRWYVATPSDCPREGGGGGGGEKRKERKKGKKKSISRNLKAGGNAGSWLCCLARGQRGFALTELKGARSGSFVPARE